MLKRMHKVLGSGAIATTLMLSPIMVHDARADHPVVMGALLGVLGGIVSSAVWDLVNEDVTTTTTTTTTTTDSEGNTTTTSTTSTEVTESPAFIHIPQDLGPLPPSSYDLNEEIYFENIANERVAIEYRNILHETDILNPSGDRARKFEIERVSTFAYTRTSGAGASTFDFSLNFDQMAFTTTNIPGTYGTVDYMMVVDSPQLGRMFASRVEVAQGSTPVVSGDIPASNFTLASGSASLNLTKMVSVAIPNTVNRVDVRVRLLTVGEGRLVP